MSTDINCKPQDARRRAPYDFDTMMHSTTEKGKEVARYGPGFALEGSNVTKTRVSQEQKKEIPENKTDINRPIFPTDDQKVPGSNAINTGMSQEHKEEVPEYGAYFDYPNPPIHDLYVPNSSAPWGNEVVHHTLNLLPIVDTTIHLTLDVQVDLDMDLDNLCRLSRLGRFSAARALFHESLESHLDNPPVVIRWAEALLRQGDYGSILKIDARPIHHLEHARVNDSGLLAMYWSLIRLTACSRGLNIDANSQNWAVLDDVVAYFHTDMAVGSMEVCLGNSSGPILDADIYYQ